MKDLSVLGIDIAKEVFHVVGMTRHGKVILRKKLHRGEFERYLQGIPRVLIGMESCASSQHWARVLLMQGHTVRLMAAQFVKPYVKSNKNDTLDAEAIAEAVTRPTMRFVPIKSVEQQDIQSLHRVRERLVKARTALVNEMRGLLSEYGIVLPQGRAKFSKLLAGRLTEEREKLTLQSLELFTNLHSELRELEQRIGYYEGKLQAVCKESSDCRRLLTIPGIGFLSATALLAVVGDVTCFKNGREFAAWLGLVPRQYSTGGKPRLGRISKRGDKYVRKLMVHGARANLRYLNSKSDRKSVWAAKLKERTGSNKTAVALANKTAREVWVLLSRKETFKTFAVPA